MFPAISQCRFGKLLRPGAALGILLLAAGAAAQTKTSHPPSITVNASVTVVESAQETAPVRRATQDLLADFARVFGKAPRLVSSLDEAGPVAILIAQNSNLPAGTECATAADSEGFAFSITAAGVGPTRRSVLCLTGADMRGTIFAIYEFSQKVLGVDPMYLWTDKQPAKRISITLPADFAHSLSQPGLQVPRLLPQRRRPADRMGDAEEGRTDRHCALHVWDMVFETILRLKGNMVVPGTWIFPDDAQVRRGHGARADREPASCHPAGRERGALAAGMCPTTSPRILRFWSARGPTR